MNTIHITHVPNPNIRYFKFYIDGLLTDIPEMAEMTLPKTHITSSDNRNFRIEKNSSQTWSLIEEEILTRVEGSNSQKWTVKRFTLPEDAIQSEVEGRINALDEDLNELIELLK